MMLFVKKVGILHDLTRSQVDSFVKVLPSNMDYMVKDSSIFNEKDDKCGLNKYNLIIFIKEK